MDIGMLWFDDDTRRSLEEKVARAVEHYKTKYGTTPTVCFVNPAMLNGGPDAARSAAGHTANDRMAGGVLVRPARTVMVHHFWVGVGDAATRAERGNGHGARKKKRA